MALIKGRNAQHMAGQAVIFDLGNLSARAQSLLEEAQERAQEILAFAQVEAQKLIDEAAERGFAQGKESGEAAGQAQGYDEGRQQVLDEVRPQLEQLMTSWQQALQQWETERDAMFLSARQDALRLAIAIADRVVHRMPSVDPTIIEDQIHEALKYVGDGSALEIMIHPEDRAWLDPILPALLNNLQKSAHATLIDDDRVERGGCIVKAGQGEIDARLSTQIDRIAEALTSVGVERGSSPASSNP